MKPRDEYYPLKQTNAPPPEMLHPSCPGCGRLWLALPKGKSVGGASVQGPFCMLCLKKLGKEEL